MLQFKKGAFTSLRSVQPLYIETGYSGNISPSQASVGFLSHLEIIAGSGLLRIKVHYFPDFEPNDYFWKHHWQEGKEEKWEAFARVVRDIISAYSGLKKTDLAVEDKFAYDKALKEVFKTNKHK